MKGTLFAYEYAIARRRKLMRQSNECGLPRPTCVVSLIAEGLLSHWSLRGGTLVPTKQSRKVIRNGLLCLSFVVYRNDASRL